MEHLITLDVPEKRLEALQYEFNDTSVRKRLLPPHITVTPPWTGSGVEEKVVSRSLKAANLRGSACVEGAQAFTTGKERVVHVLELQKQLGLVALQKALASELGVEPNYEFSPHITVGYRKEVSAALLELLDREWTGRELQYGPLTVYTKTHGTSWQEVDKYYLA